MNTSTSTRLGQILLDKGLVTSEQLELAIKEQQKRRQLLDPFDANLGVNSSLGEILIELGFIDRLQLKRGLNWQLMLRKMAIVMSFCAPLMTVSYGAAAATGTQRPTFTNDTSSSSVAPRINPTFTRTSSSSSSAPALVVDNDSEASSSVDSKPEPTTVSSAASSSSRAASSVKSYSSSSKASSVASSVSKSSVAADSFSVVDTTAPKMPEKITVTAALYDRVQLSWNEATDAVGVTHYKVYRDQVQIDTLDGYQTDYIDFNIAPGKTYLYGVSAGDDAGNWSVIKSVFVQTAATAVDNNAQTSSVVSSSSKAAVTSSSTSSKAASVVSSISSSSKAPSSVVSNSSSSSKAASSIASSVSSSKASSSAASSLGTAVAGPVNFNWNAPTLRENGNALDITEVGGYELRYRKVADTNFTYVTINDAWKNYHNFSWLDGTFIFQIAAFDKNGNYSSFVDIAPH